MNNENKSQNKFISGFKAHRLMSLTALLATLWIIFLKMLFEPTFFDGVTYAAVAQNLASQPQSFWQLTYTETIFSNFVEHPPLFIWLLHLAFLLPPLPFPPELCFNFLLLFCILILIQKIWLAAQVKTTPHSSAWIPITFFLLTPLLRESFSSSLIDNLICAFNLLTVLLLLSCHNASIKKVVRTCVFVGVITFLGVLAKGPVGLYPLLPCIVVPFFFPNQAIRRYGLFLPLIVCLFLLGGLCLQDNAYTYLSQYFHQQVIASLLGSRSAATDTDWGHLYLLQRLLTQDLLFVIVLSAFSIVVYKHRGEKPNKQDLTASSFFFVLGALGTLPLLITAKQWPFYNVPALPFFIFSGAFMVKELFESFYLDIFNQRILRRISIIVFFLCVGLWTNHKFQDLQREGVYWNQWYDFFERVPKGITLETCTNLKRDFSLHAYAKRFGTVSLFLKEGVSNFHLTNSTCEKPKDATLLAKGPRDYELWIKHKSNP